jgi:broad-specificity NMP kinase
MLVELAGLPGAGKSTIFDLLLARDPQIAPMPILRRGPHRGVLARELVRTAARLARRRALDRSWNRELLVMAAYLDALPPVLAERDGVVVFDQGPIYALCRPQMRDPRLSGWRDERLARWAGLLDLVVVLEAPDTVLVERVNAREKAHRLKGVDDPSTALRHDHEVLEAALSRVAAVRDPARILRVDTGTLRADAAADEILNAIRRP